MDIPKRVRIFLSSPGDVTEERQVVIDLVKSLSNEPLLRNKATFQIVAWDDLSARTPMIATLTPQEAINRRLPLPSECDIVVVILWSRMGTPLPDTHKKANGDRYLSGTEWEYESAVEGSKNSSTGLPLVALYRKIAKPSIQLDDSNFEVKREQFYRVKNFFEQFSDPDGSLIGGYNKFSDIEEFRQLITIDLRDLVDNVLERKI